jgi:hypothetical protein
MTNYGSRSSALIALIIALGGSYPLPAEADEWYRTEAANCSGERALGDAISALTGGGVALGSGDGFGKYYVPLSATILNSMATQNAEKIENLKALDASQAKTLKNLFLAAAENAKVPTFINVGTSIATGLLLSPVGGTATGLAFNFLFSRVDANTVSVHDVGLFFAEGGEVYRRVVLKRRQGDENPFLFTTSEYRVSVGAEKRTFVVDGCIYPVAVSVSEFETTGQFNNKIIKSAGNNKWTTWDVDDKKFEGEPYTYVYQAGGYYYFEREQMESNQIVGKNLYRISLFGGPFSTMDYDTRPDGKWKNFYLKVIAR